MNRVGNKEELLQNLEHIARYLREEAADIVLLQEVDKGTQRTYEVDEAKWLGDRLGFNSVFSTAIEMDNGGEYGLAILSRWPIENHKKADLFRPNYSDLSPALPDYYMEQRIVLSADIVTTAGIVRVLNAHLGLTQDQRNAQLKQVANLVSHSGTQFPTIFGGDLNAEPDAQELIPIRLVLRDCYQEFEDEHGLAYNIPIRNRLTFPADNPDRCIDYLYVTPKNIRVTSTHVSPVEWSDHRPVVSEVVFVAPVKKE